MHRDEGIHSIDIEINAEYSHLKIFIKIVINIKFNLSSSLFNFQIPYEKKLQLCRFICGRDNCIYLRKQLLGKLAVNEMSLPQYASCWGCPQPARTADKHHERFAYVCFFGFFPHHWQSWQQSKALLTWQIWRHWKTLGDHFHPPCLGVSVKMNHCHTDCSRASSHAAPLLRELGTCFFFLKGNRNIMLSEWLPRSQLRGHFSFISLCHC